MARSEVRSDRKAGDPIEQGLKHTATGWRISICILASAAADILTCINGISNRGE